MNYVVQLFNFDDKQPGREVNIPARNSTEAERRALDRFPWYDTASVSHAGKRKVRRIHG